MRLRRRDRRRGGTAAQAVARPTDVPPAGGVAKRPAPRSAATRAVRPGARPRPPQLPRPLGWLVVAACGALTVAVALAPPPLRSARGPTLVYGEDGALIARLAAGQRLPVSQAQVPYALRAATVAAEDATFYRNFGIDPAAIVRAALSDLRARAVVEGGSTIAQQLAKNLYLSPSRTLGRKLLELVYTLRLEATHSRDQILLMYLNTVYYGEGAYGVGAAAQVYFARPVSRLDLAQAALLAGLTASPQRYDPYVHPRAALARRRWVLGRMARLRFATPAAAAAADAEPLHLERGSLAVPGPPSGYFVQFALAEIGRHDPALEAAVRAGGYRVYTTLDPAMQAAADADFASYMPPGTPDAHGVLQPQGALVAIDPRSGALRAMIGGRSFRSDPYNRAVYALRQPGSTFKPFLYATAVADGYPVTARLFDGPVTYPGAGGRPYTVRDYDGYSWRWLTMREAMARSVNVVAVKWARIVGPAAVVATARRLGLTTPMQPTLALVLGAYATTPLDLAEAYVPLANGGWALPAWCVRRVVDATGATVWAPAPPAPARALDPGVAYIVTSLLESVMADGTGAALQPVVGRPVAGKTGSTDRLEDAWMAGYTPDLVAVVWVGDDRPAPMAGYGATLAGPVWAHFLADALAQSAPRDFPRPPDVRVLTVSAVDGLLPNPTSPRVQEVFLTRAMPRRRSPLVGFAGRDPGIVGLPGSQVTAGPLGLPLPPAASPGGPVMPTPSGAPPAPPVRLPPAVAAVQPPRPAPRLHPPAGTGRPLRRPTTRRR